MGVFERGMKEGRSIHLAQFEVKREQIAKKTSEIFFSTQNTFHQLSVSIRGCFSFNTKIKGV